MSESGDSTPQREPLTTRLGRLWQTCLEQEPLWVVVFLLVGSFVLLPQGPLFVTRVQPGQIAARDYVASREILKEDGESTDEKRSRARDGVLTVYDYEPGAGQAREGEIVQVFEVGRATALAIDDGFEELADVEGPDALSALMAASSLQISSEQLDVIKELEFSEELEDRLKNLLTEVLRRGVVSNRAGLLEERERGIHLRNLAAGSERVQLDLYRYLDYPEGVRELVVAESRRWRGINSRQRTELENLVVANSTPNIFLNRSETLVRKEQAAESAGAVFQRIRAGQVIVRRGDEIDDSAAFFINEDSGRRSRGSLLLPAAGHFLLLTLGAFTIWLAAKREISSPTLARRTFTGLLMIVVAGLLGLEVSMLFSEALSGFFETAPLNSPGSYLFAIPFAAVALIGFLLYGRSLTLVSSLVYSVLAGQIVPERAWSVVIYSLVGSLSAIYFMDRVKHRSSVNRTGLLVGGVNMVSVMMIETLTSGGPIDLSVFGFSVACGLVGGLLVAAVAGFAVPLFEWLLSITTEVTLVELSNTNLPVLRRLAFEAPGTFQHSLMVANLAKAGCAEIGADAVLAYAAGLYHDIGKLNRPEYFIENQRGVNPHDRLDPALSARIVVDHVTGGLRLAKEVGLPQVVHDAISQHHGTNLMGFFYNRANELDEGVDEEAFRYPGPRPQNRVMGTLMLADAVEAASRSLDQPTPRTLRNVVDQMFTSHVEAGQLDETDLTLADLKKLADEFQRVLETLHHRRVDYPGFDFKDGESDAGGGLRVVRNP
ncbi:MAG: HDIG domain-containing metalloprotein [Acidobacteriota bacterium]|nr:HDIG domain-containing metalloprotein [Acidobacteriota bacterium]